MKYVPSGKAIWNVNGGFVSVLLTHLFIYLVYGLCASFHVMLLSLLICTYDVCSMLVRFLML